MFNFLGLFIAQCRWQPSCPLNPPQLRSLKIVRSFSRNPFALLEYSGECNAHNKNYERKPKCHRIEFRQRSIKSFDRGTEANKCHGARNGTKRCGKNEWPIFDSEEACQITHRIIRKKNKAHGHDGLETVLAHSPGIALNKII